MSNDLEIVANYVSACDFTASNTFNPDNVGLMELIYILQEVIHTSQQMDKFKKALFRKRTREESGLLEELEPLDSLAAALASRDIPLESVESLFHGVIGMITEVGELAEVVYNLLDFNEAPDVTNVKEEIGDNLWYISRLVKWAGTSFPAEMERNILKLHARHGASGFSKEKDINRDLPAERALLEGEGEG